MVVERSVKVWDMFVRLFHWLLAACFVVAYVSEGEPLWLHSWTGYVIAILIGLRVIWGVTGPQYARFAEFIYRPGSVLGYLRGLITGKAKRYLGHSPAGGAMVVALLVALAGTAGSGMALHAVRNNAGPLAGLIVAPTVDQAIADDSAKDGKRPRKPGRALKEVHEIFANLTLVLVLAHLGGVVLASWAHRENLARSMVDGRKRPLSH